MSERLCFRDAVSGRVVTQWTQSAACDQALYFTSPSVTRDERWLVFLSDRDGHPNLWKIDRRSGQIRRISANAAGLLQAYVYPEGTAQGLSKASPCLDADRGVLYWIEGHAVYRADLATEDEPVRLAELPGGTWTAFTHVDPTGRWLCVPVTDERAFSNEDNGQWGQMQGAVERIKRLGLASSILYVDTEKGEVEVRAEGIPFWVTHVQFNPKDAKQLIFNMEGGSLIDQRIWCLEADGSWRALYPQPSEAWASHENWLADGSGIIYHGGPQRNDPEREPFVAIRAWSGELLREYSLAGVRFLHATPTDDGESFLIDQKEGALARYTFVTGEMEVLCDHGSSSAYQDTHVHALQTPSGDGVVFTSDRAGSVNVYEVGLKEEGR